MPITLTKSHLFSVLLQWEKENRDGGCLTEAEARDLPIEQRVQESTDYVWQRLSTPA